MAGSALIPVRLHRALFLAPLLPAAGQLVGSLARFAHGACSASLASPVRGATIRRWFAPRRLGARRALALPSSAWRPVQLRMIVPPHVSRGAEGLPPRSAPLVTADIFPTCPEADSAPYNHSHSRGAAFTASRRSGERASSATFGASMVPWILPSTKLKKVLLAASVRCAAIGSATGRPSSSGRSATIIRRRRRQQAGNCPSEEVEELRVLEQAELLRPPGEAPGGARGYRLLTRRRLAPALELL